MRQDRSHTPLAIDPCVLILFRRVSVACLYPFRKIHMRDLEGLCMKRANRVANPAKDLIVAFAEDDSSILTIDSNAWPSS